MLVRVKSQTLQLSPKDVYASILLNVFFNSNLNLHNSFESKFRSHPFGLSSLRIVYKTTLIGFEYTVLALVRLLVLYVMDS